MKGGEHNGDSEKASCEVESKVHQQSESKEEEVSV
jgi:hypothetical protein